MAEKNSTIRSRKLTGASIDPIATPSASTRVGNALDEGNATFAPSLHDLLPSHSNYPRGIDSVQEQQPAQVQQEEKRVEGNEDKAFKNFLNLTRYTSIVLENKNSTARDHLSNERTLLAWVRTCTTFLTVSIGMLQIFLVQEMAYSSKPICITAVIISILSLIFGTSRYIQVQSLLMQDYFPATRFALAVLVVLAMVITLLVLVLVVKIL